MTLRVRFLGGDSKVQAKVVDVAQEWTSFANLEFDFGDHRPSEIRIAFQQDGTSWSHIGRDSWFGQDKPSMNFGWLDRNTPENETRQVVLHEFGHALGFVHEHQSPAATVPWDRNKVYEYYKRTHSWSAQEVDSNILQPYDRGSTNFSKFDAESIMIYHIPEELTIGNFSVPWNSELSESDKTYAQVFYPLPPKKERCQFCGKMFLPSKLPEHVNDQCRDNPWYWHKRNMHVP